MSKKLKVILSIFGLILVLGGGLVFYVSTKISPEEIRKLTLSMFEKKFPNAELEIGQIEYSIGPSIVFRIDQMNLKSKVLKEDLLNLKQVKVKLPIWAILTNQGTVEVDIDSPQFNFRQLGEEKDNWSTSLKNETEVATEEKNEGTTGNKKVEVPAFVEKSRLNLNITNLNLNYDLLKSGKGKVVLSKLMIKDLGLASEFAIEMETNVNMILENKQTLAMKSLLVGQVDISKYLDEKSLKASLDLRLTDLILPGLKKQIPSIKSKIDFSIDPAQTMVINLESALLEKSTFKTNVEIKEKNIYIKGLDLSVYLEEALALLDLKIENFRAKDSRFNLSGSMDLLADRTEQSLKIQVAPALEMTLKDIGPIETRLDGSIENGLLKMDFSTQMMKGLISSKVRANLGPDLRKIDPARLGEIKLDVLLSKLKVPRELIQEKMYPKDKKVVSNPEEEVQKNEAPTAKSKAPNFPQLNFNLAIVDLDIGGEKFQAKANILTKKNNVLSDNFNFALGKGKGDIKFDTTFGENSALKGNLFFKLMGLNLDALHPFLPPNLGGIKGVFDGIVKGQFSSKGAAKDYNFAVDVKATNGEFKGLKINEYIQSLIDGLGSLKAIIGTNEYKISDKFDLLETKGVYQPDSWLIQNFKFVGIKNALEFNLNGELFPLTDKKNGELMMTFQDRTGKISIPLKKNLGTDIIPVKLEGPKMTLRPNIAYTADKMLKSGAKTKVTETVNKEIQKVIDKNVKKEDVKNLLKGLFK